MKRASRANRDPDMLDEYDFSQGVRGKYASRYRKGSNVVILPPDLAEVFPNAESVHTALRALVKLARKSAPKASA